MCERITLAEIGDSLSAEHLAVSHFHLLIELMCNRLIPAYYGGCSDKSLKNSCRKNERGERVCVG